MMAMERRTLTVALLIFSILTLAFITLQTGKAENTKTIVVPDNYASIQEAINATHNGDTILVKKGTYDGAINQTITINKAITLVGEGADTTVLNLHPQKVLSYIFSVPLLGTNDAIRIESSNVKISGLTIVTPSGIAILADKVELDNNNLVAFVHGQCNDVNIVGNNIIGQVQFEGANQTIRQNTINGTISINGKNNCVLSNVISASNHQEALDIRDDSNLIFNNTIINEQLGIKLEYRSSNNVIAQNNLSACALSLETNCSNNTVFGNNFQSISLMGFNNTFFANNIAYVVNIGGWHGGTTDAAFNSFYHNNFLGIYKQNFLGFNPELMIYTKNLGPLSWDNGTQGNYWSQYQGTDSNNDEIGDSSYTVTASYANSDGTNHDNEIINCGQDNYPLMSPFDISSVPVTFPSWAAAQSAASPTLSPSASVPEFPTWTALPAILVVMSLAVVVIKKKLGNQKR